MKAPVWFLLARLTVVGGSTGYHRAYLIDRAIANFGEWFLVGVPSTSHWGWGLQDVTNQFIVEGTRGGLLTLVLFVAVIVYCFKGLGLARAYLMHSILRCKFSCGRWAQRFFPILYHFSVSPISIKSSLSGICCWR
jgi:hypothetical protein